MPTYQEITEEYIEYLRLSYSLLQIGFEIDDDKNEIVPKKFTHEYLRDNFSIDKNILDYYYLQSNNLISEEEYQDFLSKGYYGAKNRCLRPYSVLIFGAYYSRIDIYYKLSNILPKLTIYHPRPDVNSLGDLIPYFKDYATGFKKGYDGFVEECINPYLLLPNDKTDFVFKVSEFLTNRNANGNAWIGNIHGFRTQYTIGETHAKIVGAFDEGLNQGYFYKAWTIVFGAHQNFTEYFKSLDFSKASSKTIINNDNPFPHIFSNKGYKVFEAMHEEYKVKKPYLSKYSFLYWKMHEDAFIHEYIKPDMFRKLLTNDPFKLDLESCFKTYDRTSPHLKLEDYNTAKMSVE